MSDLKTTLKNLARELGAEGVGIGSLERLSGAPPSGDPGYLLPTTVSVISYFMPYDRRKLREFFSKVNWRIYGEDQKSILQALYRIGDSLVRVLREHGHEAVCVDMNCAYRPEKKAAHFTDLTDFVPDFSHQYGALAAGLGRLGLSGNLLTPEYGAAVLLGTVLTSAALDPDPLCRENPCDRCGLCVAVCPVRMMDAKNTQTSCIAGMKEEIAARRPHSCCWIGCGDYHGLSPDGVWSNWSPYRIDQPIPCEKEDLDTLLINLRKQDPESFTEPNPYTDYRAVVLNPDWRFSATCGNCANICWKEREERKKNMRLVVSTGVVALRADGVREATHEDVVELDAPYGLKVAVARSEYNIMRKMAGQRPEFRGHLEKDREVLELILRKTHES